MHAFCCTYHLWIQSFKLRQGSVVLLHNAKNVIAYASSASLWGKTKNSGSKERFLQINSEELTYIRHYKVKFKLE